MDGIDHISGPQNDPMDFVWTEIQEALNQENIGDTHRPQRRGHFEGRANDRHSQGTHSEFIGVRPLELSSLKFDDRKRSTNIKSEISESQLSER